MVDRIDQYLQSQQNAKLDRRTTLVADKAAEEEKSDNDGQSNLEGNVISKE